MQASSTLPGRAAALKCTGTGAAAGLGGSEINATTSCQTGHLFQLKENIKKRWAETCGAENVFAIFLYLFLKQSVLCVWGEAGIWGGGYICSTGL